MQYSESFLAMGTTVDITVETDSPPLAELLSIRLLFQQQEAKFSRFRPDSLLARLNAGDSIDDAGLASVCRLALEAHVFTRGAFNPMVLPALREAGYDRTFAEVAGGHPRAQSVPNLVECLEIDGSRVRLRHGQVDLGGIAKGWTVDLAVEAFGRDLSGLLVNAGGDLRCAGNEQGFDGWWVEVDGPAGIAWEGAVSGAVATSTTRKRRWRSDDGHVAHHIIDPRTGLPAASVFSQVTAWGAEAWRAECWAKAVLIGGPLIAAEAEEAGYRILTL